MENVMTLNAGARTETGKKIAKKLRREGLIPAIIYGGNVESMPISLAVNDLKKILKSESGENTVLRIVQDKVTVDAMFKEIQYDYLSDNIIHLDLIRIDLTQMVTINVPIIITGEPIGVKIDGGIFDFMRRDVKVKCLPTAIPKEFIIDVTHLHAGESIKVKDIPLQEGIKLISGPNTVICAVSAKSGEETPAGGQEAAAAETPAK